MYGVSGTDEITPTNPGLQVRTTDGTWITAQLDEQITKTKGQIRND
jgi:hypothetical protein